MAPKPKVWRTVQGWLWKWSCECGIVSRPWSGWRYAHAEATGHSRTHTAERISEQLEEWAGDVGDPKAGGAYWEGYLDGAAEGLRDAANIIREHLVKEGP